MTAVRAPQLGTEYQDLFFWLEASRLLFPRPAVATVSLEKPTIRAFDDVVARYTRAVLDAHSRRIDADHTQLKFRLTNRALIAAEDLIDPAFINADSISLLERVRDAVRAGELPSRLSIVTPWSIDPEDPLAELVSNRNGEMIIDRLFIGGRRSRMGKVRAAWKTRLGLQSEDDLKPILRHLRIWSGRAMMQLEEQFDDRLRLAGLTPHDRSVRVNPYFGLARRFIVDRIHDFDANALRAVCEEEGLWLGRDVAEGGPDQLAIKSFSRFAATLEDEADVLDLVPFFHGRQLSTDVAWSDLADQVAAFIEARVVSGGVYHLHLDCHASLAAAAGWTLQKADADIAPVQRGRAQRSVWRPAARVDAVPVWIEEIVEMGGGPDVALALSTTHSVLDDAVLYLSQRAPHVGRLLHLTVADGPSQTAVRDADHALALAQRAATRLREFRTDRERTGRVHLFAAAPNGLLFFYGREAATVGPMTVYEYNFDELRPGDYSPGISLPR
jgi:hypothetical protein